MCHDPSSALFFRLFLRVILILPLPLTDPKRDNTTLHFNLYGPLLYGYRRPALRSSFLQIILDSWGLLASPPTSYHRSERSTSNRPLAVMVMSIREPERLN
ncbi:hypothetical protein B0H16DRAFT_1494089 [Mycena metata]|uniref:Secreted protein n=1 Tax=Mycena metata TaxID=1033252 RepID=A0AAD7KC85_9AGAR|nr:hypothetical protein B0H16DRAFT_1494089 [Mycena metata]